MADPARGGDRLEPRGNQRAVVESDAACVSVDAGAGTGKTTTMLLRIERAIERGDLDPDDVLVLTFANEAAASIRAAVDDRLEPEAAAAIDVFTYHSFCHRLVREYAYALGYSPEFDVVTDGERRRIVARLLAGREYDFAASFVDGSDEELVDRVTRFIDRASRENVRPADLQTDLPDTRTVELCLQFVRWLERRADDSLTFDEEALRFFSRESHVETARDALHEYGTLLEFCREKIAEAPVQFREDDVVSDVDRYLRAMQETVARTAETLSLEDRTTKHLPRVLFANEIHGGATARIEQTPIGRLKHYLESCRLARYYADVYADYHAHLEAERALDFDELVRTATALVSGDEETTHGVSAERVASEITDRWEQVYCDEFQDTDETQFDLVTALTDGPDRPDLLAIGDTDQAIYGWRGTDREGLTRLGEAFDDHEAIELELNFRSRQEILDVTNHCAYGGQSSKTLREVDRPPGSHWRPGEVTGSDDGRRKAPAEPAPPDRVVTVESDALEASPAEQVATTVSRLLNGEAATVPQRDLGDIAVIVRRNRQAQAVAAALREKRIPYEVTGSPRGEISPGIQTLLSYLRVVVDPGPTTDVHLRRVLTYRYRVTAGDLRRLGRGDESLASALRSFDVDAVGDEFDHADRLERARDHLEALLEQRDVYPVSGFLRRFRERTRIEWFLTREERADLDRLDRFVDSSGSDGVGTVLSASFVDAVERLYAGSDRDRTQGTTSTECVDVMTVHQAKGLEFDTVLVPYLSDAEWCVDGDHARRSSHRLVAATLDEDVDSPLCEDVARDRVAEEWRVLHVALTRAENHLFCFGSTYDYDGEPEALSTATADACLAPELEWSTAGQRMDLWETLIESVERVRETYPESVADRTDEIGRSSEATPGTITYYAGLEDRRVEPLETQEAIETVHRLGRLLRNGTLLPASDAADATDGWPTEADGGIAKEGPPPTSESDREVRVPTGRALSALAPEAGRFPVDALSSATDLPVAMRHSYTALETHESCPRKHYLDHVVGAFDDPTASGEAGEQERDSSRQPGRSASRIVGTVVHDVAEEAFYRGYRTRERWHAAATRQLTARGLTAHRDAVFACIDHFFEARAPGIDRPVAEWEAVAAELPFVLDDVPGVTGEVVGYVDSIRRLPEGSADSSLESGDLVVLDYKTTAKPTTAEGAVQLALYQRACADRFDDPIAAAGYVYVGDGVGPRVDLFDPDELPPWEALADALAAVDDPGFTETNPGDHCQYCPHRSLGCGPKTPESVRTDGG
ncbi:UvrD-helicase domain-containing protein [Natrarchaeobaculum aegyptiacum]|uniref:DNA 3'-5' helicase n=1 Tax=Natrarchaeobaculum aegyptiacum TaxID=745377 RepID=A0A2Z2HX28_9EURY|nr:UvrD-helicase domain-containing protein [Natrarchaeobaculum aegyptiacum]ARS91423.1 ATP-dependent DNA helicase [Natrarchaeobaculum aegyptiacum]